MIRNRYTVGKENIPAKGEKYFIACNHQNAANDAINIAFAYPVDYLQHFVVRANVFSLNPAITSFLSWLGLMPAFEENYRLFDRLAVRINQGRNVLVFPESGHTQGHYLDPFSTGLVRMAFHTAKYNDWKEDIKILPTAHHYSDYHDAQYDFLWMVGEPISLQPYYAEFQEHPYRVMREVTRKMRASIQSMMLDEGQDHYAEKDFLRRSALNPATMKDLPLPEKLAEDKVYVGRNVGQRTFGACLAAALDCEPLAPHHLLLGTAGTPQGGQDVHQLLSTHPLHRRPLSTFRPHHLACDGSGLWNVVAGPRLDSAVDSDWQILLVVFAARP